MEQNIPRWMSELPEEDWQFIKRFILASGSLKEVAGQYGISYPTVRARLDRLIEKVRILEDTKAKSPFHRKVQLLVAEGKLDIAVARTLLKAHEDSE
jgi:hypothetical protein